MTIRDADDILSTADILAEYGFARSTIAAAVAAGRLTPAFRSPRASFFYRKDIEAYVASPSKRGRPRKKRPPTFRPQ